MADLDNKAFDEAFKQEMRAQDLEHYRLSIGTKTLEALVYNVAMKTGACEHDVVHSDKVNILIDVARDLCSRGGNKTDIAEAIRLLLAATWRFSAAAVKGVDRITNPASNEGPDDPLDV